MYHGKKAFFTHSRVRRAMIYHGYGSVNDYRETWSDPPD